MAQITRWGVVCAFYFIKFCNMKSNDISVVSGSDTGDVVLVLTKRKFPWWILLLLIPLILLIPVGRNINAIITDQSGSIPLSDQQARIVYPEISTFGSAKPVSVDLITDAEGKMSVRDLRVPLWYRLFAGRKDSVYISSTGDCSTLAGGADCYRSFPDNEYRSFAAASITASDVVKVVDADKNAPLEGATVLIQILQGGNSLEKISDQSGNCQLQDISVCTALRIVGSKPGYINDTIEATMRQLTSMSPSDKTLRLRKPEPPKIDPPRKDPPKKETPKIDPPRQDPPRQDPPPNHRQMKGQSGALRVNLQWSCTTDLDLQVVNPCGDTIQAHKNGQMCHGVKSGVLDVDANSTYTNDPYCCTTTTPQENMYWTKAVRGKYIIIVDCYFWRERHSNPIDFTITIEDRGKLTYKTGKINKNQRHLVVCTYDIDYD